MSAVRKNGTLLEVVIPFYRTYLISSITIRREYNVTIFEPITYRPQETCCSSRRLDRFVRIYMQVVFCYL